MKEQLKQLLIGLGLLPFAVIGLSAMMFLVGVAWEIAAHALQYLNIILLGG